MAAFYDHLKQQAKPYETIVKTLLNNELKAICKEEGLQVSGVKSVLQSRIIQRIDDAVQSCDAPRFHDICGRIGRYGKQSSNQNPPSNANPPPSQSQRPIHGSNSNLFDSMSHHYVNPSNVTKFPSLQYHGNITKMFRENPFYVVQEQMTNITPLPVLGPARNSSSTTLKLNNPQVYRLQSDRSLRLMIYCYVEYESTPHDISFPMQIEIKVNGDQFQGNLRGLKKKPGTTKPADITRMIKIQPFIQNSIAINYASIDKKYCFVVCLVQTVTVEQLVERIKTGSFISKQSVINEMINKAKDPDLVTTSSVMSLKCPLSATRMELPCRSVLCQHNQCFDATSFLQLQEQAPQWTCPICNKSFNFQSLVIDRYVQDILNSVPKSTEQVTIEPTGAWKQGFQNDDEFRVPSSKAKRTVADAWDIDAGSPAETFESRINGIRAESVSTPQSYARTPTFSSREPSTSASTAPPRSASKRPAEEVIDLTLSDDDEDEPPRPPTKRQSTGSFHFSSSSSQHMPGGFANGQSLSAPRAYSQYSPMSQDPPHFSMNLPHKSTNQQQQQQQQQYSPPYHDWYGSFGS